MQIDTAVLHICNDASVSVGSWYDGKGEMNLFLLVSPSFSFG